MKLGICCVYFYGPDSHWLLKLQLSYIEQTLQGYDYTIYAAANRLLSEYLPSLKAHPRVTIVPLPVHRGTHPGQEHAFYLDRLLLVAAEDGCTHLATLDADSFPVLPGWPHELIGRMGTSRLAAVLRSENLDTCLPHPCGYFMQRSLLLERRPCLYPDVEVSKSDDFQNFLRETGQRIDTGIGYAYTLWKSREHWFPLQRSNKRNLHYLMAGIYGNIFFHLGASSRPPTFYADSTQWAQRLAKQLKSMPLLWRLSPPIRRWHLKTNEAIHRRIVEALKTDPAGFMAWMSGTDRPTAARS